MSDCSDRWTTPQKLRRFCVEAMLRAGLNEQHSQIAADVLVTTDTWGVHTHGTKQLRPLLQNVRLGKLDAQATPSVVNEGPAWAIVDGHYAMPMVTAHFAMGAAVDKARLSGVSYAGVFHSSHFGAAGYYARMPLQSGMIGIAVSNVDPCMTVPGGRAKVLGTNPIAFAIPAGEEPAVVLDIATSAVAASKILAAKFHGRQIPNDWLVDDDGIPTTDASIFPDHGAQLPMAGHKGYGLALLVEVLAAVLTGADMTTNVQCWLDESAGITNQGHAFLAIDIASMMPPDRFKDRMDAVIQGIKESSIARGADRIFLPGEMEWESRERVREEGLMLPSDVVASLTGLAADLDLDASQLWSPQSRG